MILLKYILFPLVMAVVAAVFFFVYSKKSKLLSNKKAILTFLAVGIIITLFGAFAYFPAIYQSNLYFFVFQFVFLLFGFGALAYWNKKNDDQVQTSNIRWMGVFFVLVNMLVGMVGFTCVFNYFNDTGLAPYYSLCIIPFMLPYCIYTVYQSYIAIPEDIYKVWYYPIYDNDINTDEIDPDKAYMLEFEYTTSTAAKYTNTKIKAPIEMKFGDWFQAYIDYHNNKFDNNQIQFTNEDGTPQAWMFFVRPSMMGNTKHIDPDLTIFENKLDEKNVIIAKRVNNHEPINE